MIHIVWFKASLNIDLQMIDLSGSINVIVFEVSVYPLCDHKKFVTFTSVQTNEVRARLRVRFINYAPEAH